MHKILKVINTWIKVEQELLSNSTGIPTAESYHSGALSYLSKVVTLLEQHLTNQSSGWGKAQICLKCGSNL
ncbi:unnamed protein product, partial [marine sediment metagenome]